MLKSTPTPLFHSKFIQHFSALQSFSFLIFKIRILISFLIVPVSQLGINRSPHLPLIRQHLCRCLRQVNSAKFPVHAWQ